MIIKKQFLQCLCMCVSRLQHSWWASAVLVSPQGWPPRSCRLRLSFHVGHDQLAPLRAVFSLACRQSWLTRGEPRARLVSRDCQLEGHCQWRGSAVQALSLLTSRLSDARLPEDGRRPGEKGLPEDGSSNESVCSGWVVTLLVCELILICGWMLVCCLGHPHCLEPG
jgi:hypothetical protein